MERVGRLTCVRFIMSSNTTVFKSRYVFPVDQVPLSPGFISVRDGVIEKIDSTVCSEVNWDFGNAAILPGLVNGHTHLDLCDLHGKLPAPSSLTDWLRNIVEFRKHQTQQQVVDAVQFGISQCIEAGVTLVGDIASQGLSWPVLVKSPLSARVFFELIGMHNQRVQESIRDLRSWIATIEPTFHCRMGASPHAPYSASPDLYRAVGEIANEQELTVCTHWAESLEELQLFETGTGPMRIFLEELNAWDPDWSGDQLVRLSQVTEWMAAEEVLLVHMNYPSLVTFESRDSRHHKSPMKDPEGYVLDRLQKSGKGVVYCPRTHAYFGHSQHAYRDMMRSNIRVCLGTDSLASAPDLSILEEMRYLHRTSIGLSNVQLLEMGTINGALALGFDSFLGTLSVGKQADMTVIPLSTGETADPHDLLFGSSEAVSHTFIKGECVFHKGD